MAYRLLTFRKSKRMCFSYLIKHSRLRLIVPASFIAICVLLFLKIQQFGDYKRNLVFVPNTPEADLWDDIVKSGATISNPEMFKRAMMMMRRESSNSSARVRNHIRFSQNNSMESSNVVTFEKFNSGQNPQNTSSVKENPSNNSVDVLTSQPKPTLAVILVISRPNNVLLRLAARKTWARDAELFRFLVRFVIGRQENWSDIVDRESSMHHDVIIFEEDDVEEVLPSKVIKGFEWALNLRPKPIYVMKIDDDTIVNLPYLAKELLRETTVGASQIVGVIRKEVPVSRDLQNDKWAVSMLDYPSSTYPTYVSGGGYVMRTQTAAAILEKRYFTYSWVHLEDVYLTGFVAAKAGVSQKYHRGFSFRDDKPTACDFVLETKINSINNTEQEIYELFKGIQFLLRSKNKDYCTS